MRGSGVLRAVLGLGLWAAVGLMLTGCEDDSHTDRIAGTGNLTLRGNFVSVGEARPAAAVSGARLYLDDTDVDVTADANGRFEIKGLPAGTYLAFFEHDGVKARLEIVVKEGYTLELRNIKVYEDGTLDAQVIYHPLVGKPVGNPIDLEGKWIVSLVFSARAAVATDLPMLLEQSGETLSGVLGHDALPGGMPSYNLNGSIKGNDVTLSGTEFVYLPLALSSIALTGSANDDGTYMSGNWTGSSDAGTWTARRVDQFPVD